GPGGCFADVAGVVTRRPVAEQGTSTNCLVTPRTGAAGRAATFQPLGDENVESRHHPPGVAAEFHQEIHLDAVDGIVGEQLPGTFTFCPPNEPGAPAKDPSITRQRFPARRGARSGDRAPTGGARGLSLPRS